MKKHVEHALRRRAGMPVEEAKKIAAHFRSQPDLYSICPSCGLRREGTLPEVLTPCPECAARA